MRLDHKKVLWLPYRYVSWIIHSKGSQLPYHENVQAAPQRQCGEELRPPASSYVRKPFLKQILQSQSLP